MRDDDPGAMSRRKALAAGIVSLGAGGLSSASATAQITSRAAMKPLSLNVTDAPFHAKGDGITDDRLAIQSAIDTVSAAGGGCISFPPGTYVVGAEPSGPGGLQIRSGVALAGASPRAVILKLADGANRNVIYGPAQVDRMWGSGSTGGVGYWSLFNLEIDGNRARNRTGSGVWIYGYKPFVENLFIGNVAEHGWRTEWGTGGAQFGMEGIINSVHVDTCGKHGFWFSGPHDSVVTGAFVIDASQAEANRWNSFNLDRIVGSRFVACHAWTRANSVRTRHALDDAAGASDFIGCHFEGAYNANVYARGQGSTFDSCRIFAAANGRNVVIKATEIVMKARIGLPLEGAPVSKGIILGESDNDWVAACDVDVYVTGQAAGGIDFTHSSGDNSIRMRGFQQTGTTYVGTPKPTDEVDIWCSGPAGSVFRQMRNARRP